MRLRANNHRTTASLIIFLQVHTHECCVLFVTVAQNKGKSEGESDESLNLVGFFFLLFIAKLSTRSPYFPGLRSFIECPGSSRELGSGLVRGVPVYDNVMTCYSCC